MVHTGMSEEEMALRKAELDFKKEKQQMEMEKLIKKDEEDRKLKEKKLELKEIELDRQRYKNASELKRRESLAGQAKFFGDALKHSLPKK